MCVCVCVCVIKHTYFGRNTLHCTKIFCLNVIFKGKNSIGMHCVLMLLVSRTHVRYLLTGLFCLLWPGHIKVNECILFLGLSARD